MLQLQQAELGTVMKTGHLGKEIRNTLKVLECGDGVGWRRSVGKIV
jgi:hypothetical protein